MRQPPQEDALTKGKSVTDKLGQFNHWRKGEERVNATTPRSVKGVLNSTKEKAFESQDCQADPCNCTGCSAWG